MEQSKKQITGKRKAIYIALTLLIVFLVIEAIAWVAYFTMISERERTAIQNVVSGRSTAMISQYCIPHPYSLFMLAPNYTAKGIKQHNSQGFRGDELRSQKGLYKIFCLGGSTTYGWGVKQNPKWSYPKQLELILQKNNRKVEVVNAGMPMACSAEILATLQYRLLELKPQMVIVHCGFNDTYPTLMPNYKPDYTHMRTYWRSKMIPKYRLRLNFKSFQIFYFLPRYRGQDRFKALYNHENYPKWPKYFVSSVKEAKEEKRYIGFNNNLRSLLAICQVNKIKVMLSPTTIQPGASKKYPAFTIAYKKNVEIMKKAAQEFPDIHLLKTTNLDIPKKHFYDVVHLNKEGQQIKAKAIAKAVLPLLSK